MNQFQDMTPTEITRGDLRLLLRLLVCSVDAESVVNCVSTTDETDKPSLQAAVDRAVTAVGERFQVLLP